LYTNNLEKFQNIFADEKITGKSLFSTGIVKLQDKDAGEISAIG